MSLLDTLKSLLGIGTASERSGGGDVSVTVERERSAASEPNAASEHEIKGTDEASESVPDPPSSATKPSDAAAAPPPETNDDEPTSVIKGVGETYAQRLASAGIESVSDLARADPETLADETEISEKRLSRWIDRAEAR